MTNHRRWHSIGLVGLLTMASISLTSMSAAAQYKIVGPDGRITYTDRAPQAGAGAVSAISRPVAAASAAGSDLSALPSDLRQLASRFPVLLYTGAECPPCDASRQFLQQRGIPYAERRVASDDDGAALDRLVGGRTIPSLTIGGQALRGFAPADWGAYLDAAGYPKESRLPRGWQPAPATPLVERSAVQPVAAARPESVRPAPVPVPPPTVPPEPETPGQAPAIRF